MKVAVTGGSGVVGSAVVRHLVDAGHQVTALARSVRAATDLERAGAKPVFGDLLDSLESLVSDADWVFHIAGVNQLCPPDPDLLWRVNVEGTRNVLEACRRAGVTRLVHTSSSVTIGEPKGSVGNESTVHRGNYLSHYERSKTESETMLLRDRGDLEVVVVNPSSVQGPGRATGTGRLLLAAAGGRARFAVDTVVSLVDIDDCARGHLLAASHGVPGERYLLSGATLTVRQLLAALGEITGQSRRPFYLKPGVALALSGLVGGIWSLGGGQAPVCAESARVLLHGHRYDGSKATRELGFDYTPVEATLRRTVEWFAAEGLLN